ncbi:MAG: HEAT repeat domain-containing protein [Nitrospirae bacterium YQR-1]
MMEEMYGKTDDNQSFGDMVADYMEKGFLDNIVSMFKADRDACSLIVRLIRDERMRVRIGAIALVEELVALPWRDELADMLLPLLEDESPLVRGDAAYCFGIIGGDSHIEHLSKLKGDAVKDVSEAATEAIESIMNEKKL